MLEGLAKCTNKNTSKFSFKGIKMWGRVLDVVDGDTIVCAVCVNDAFSKIRIRIAGIDTWEMKSKDEHDRELAHRAWKRTASLVLGLEKELFEGTRNELCNLLDDRCSIVQLTCYDFDMYGRVLADVEVSTKSQVKDVLIREQLAIPYSK